MKNIVGTYLDLLDSQRESAFAVLKGLDEEQIWVRSAPKEWCVGEILDHNFLLINSTMPYVRGAWRLQRRRAERNRTRPYSIEIEDPYHSPRFPMWVGFLWKPRFHPEKRIPLEALFKENRDLHAEVRSFFTGKDEDMLGNTFVYDPLFGSINLIVTLRIGIYHDQLHFDDIFKIAKSFK